MTPRFLDLATVAVVLLGFAALCFAFPPFPPLSPEAGILLERAPALEGGLLLECAPPKPSGRAWVDAGGPGAVSLTVEWDTDDDGTPEGWIRGEGGGKVGLYFSAWIGWTYRASWEGPGGAGSTEWKPCP